MNRKIFVSLSAFALLCGLLLPVNCWGRGGRGGGAARGGGFSGGVSRGGGFSGPSGFSGGMSRGGMGVSGPSFGGGARGGFPGPSGISGGARPGAGMGVGGPAGIGDARPGAGAGVGGPAGIGGGARAGAGLGVGGPAGIGGGARAGAGRSGLASDSAVPNRGQLNSFLGLPSDSGMHGIATNTGNPFGNNLDVNRGRTETAGGGEVGGVSVTGPRGNTAGRAVGVGADGGVATVGGVRGAAGGAAARGVAVGPEGAAAVSGVRGPGGAAAARGIAAGPGGVAAGFARVSPSGRYRAGVAVRTGFNHWGVYGRGWYARYPGAWLATAWATDAMWEACTWASAATYCGYPNQPPVYYDYGNNVVYEDNSVYVNGDNVGTSEEYYQQAVDTAAAGAAADATADGDWLPLGVFAFCKPDQQSSDISIQLAINKQGIIRGNYTDSATNQNQVVQGSLNKETQQVSFTVGENKTNIIETGLYNLTKDEAPCLLHFGTERTEQWLLVRLQKPAEDSSSGQ